MTSQKKFHTERRILCRFRAQRITRYLLILILCPLFIFHYPTAFYVALALTMLPPLYRHFLQSTHPQADQSHQPQSLPASEAARYHFSYTGYRAENFGALLAFALLALWQWVQPIEYWYNFPLGRVPVMLLAGYYILQTILFFVFRLRQARNHKKQDTRSCPENSRKQ